MTSLEGIPNNESADPEVNQYKQYLDEKLEAIKSQLQTESNEHTFKVFEEMKETLEKSNEDALKLYNDSLERSKSLTSDMVRNRSMQSAKKMYDMVLEINQKLLDDFIKDFNVPVKE